MPFYFRVGVMRRLEIAKRTYIYPQILVVNPDEARVLFKNHAADVCDLTPKYIASVFGIFQDRLHARFWLDRCPCRASNLPRFTACRMCGDTGRLVIT